MQLADPGLAISLLGTLRQDGDVLIDEMDDPRAARAWVRDAGIGALDASAIAEVRSFRDDVRVLLTAILSGETPDGRLLDAVNRAAGVAPVTLRASLTTGGAVVVERSGPTLPPATAALAEVARAALALLTEPFRSRLRLCNAPNCVRFFLKGHSRQEWCSPGCGNRARVARHYARHHRT